MTKLNQLVAIERDVKRKSTDELTAVYHLVQKPDLFEGMERTYQPNNDEDTELYPNESKKVQLTIDIVVERAIKSMVRLFDVTATKDYSNTLPDARGSVVLPDGTEFVKDAPVPFLLFLEKELKDLRKFIEKFPTLDPSMNWTDDQANGLYKSDPVKTAKTKKTPTAFVKAAATDKHPAQVDRIDVDSVQGTWTKVEFSGAITPTRQVELLDRVDVLLAAVKYGREQANLAEVPADVNVGAAILGYVFL